MRKLLGLIGLMGLMGLLPIKPILPINPIHAQDTNRLFLHIDGSTFFIDNEYFGDRISGYTLPGFVLQPKMEWVFDAHRDVKLKGGLHWLYYWGAQDYPARTAYGAYPLYDSMSRPMHVLPWLQASIKFNSKLKLYLGCLDPDGHDLPLPLYNPELALVGDPETGFQIKFNGNWLKMDIWTDWREYIWDRSPVPERFTAGASGRLVLNYKDWQFYLPLHFVVQHEGGQNMSVSHNINNNFNAAAGLGLYSLIGENFYYNISCRAFWYHQHGNPTVPFSTGWGLYPEVKTCLYNRWILSASYWHGKDFVPLMGCWHFSNLSANTAGLTFDRTRVITLQASWTWIPVLWPRNCHLSVYGTLYHYLPSTGTFADGTTKDYGHRNQFAVGAALNFYPSIKLF